MLVVHPKDRTTRMLAALYEGQQVRLLDQNFSSAEINRALFHTSRQERILLLGHGSDQGLFSRENDEADDFDRLIVSHTHAYALRRHGGNLVGIWCHARLFAQAEGLHGLFSGMIITEMSEAEYYGVETTPEELKQENELLGLRLRQLLDEDISLMDFPQRMRDFDQHHTSLTDFNYQNFYYL